MARQRLISARLFVGAAALAVAATGALAGSASAHVAGFSHTCSSFTVDLSNYNPDATNVVTVTVDGVVKVDSQHFSTSFKQEFDIPADHAAPIDAVLTVAASDHPKPGEWAGTWTQTAPVCPPPSSPPPPPVSPTTPPPSTPAPTTPAPTSAKPTSAAPVVPKPTPTPTPPAPKPSPTGPSLAFTGGGSDAGLIAGVGGAVVVLGGGLVYLSRRRAGRH